MRKLQRCESDLRPEILKSYVSHAWECCFEGRLGSLAFLIPHSIAYKLRSLLNRFRSMLNLNTADSKFFERDAPIGRNRRGDQDHFVVGSLVRLPHQPVVFENLPDVFSPDRVSLQLDDVLHSVNVEKKVDATAFYKDLP